MPMEEILKNEFQGCTDFKEEGIQLEPFIHQVGGHSSILCLDERTVCKPLIKQELKFYETLPSCMKKFVPEYKGIVLVRFEEDSDGYITVAAYPPKSFRHHQLSTNKKRGAKGRRIRLKNSGSIEVEIDSELNELFVEDKPTPKSTSSSSSTSSSNGGQSVRGSSSALNPWVLKCHQNQLSKLSKLQRSGPSMEKEKEPHAQKFVLLENLTNRFEYPCVLDLKMGTRQYGDDATPAKIESQSAKAAQSTSVQLGVRICGMQVYQVKTGKFICRNKYYGRKLNVDGFRDAICQFLHNGSRLRTDALIPLVEKLQELKTTLSTLDTFRFYTSSLLLIYEGLDPELDENLLGTSPSDVTINAVLNMMDVEDDQNLDGDMDVSEDLSLSETKSASTPTSPLTPSVKPLENLVRGSSLDGVYHQVPRSLDIKCDLSGCKKAKSSGSSETLVKSKSVSSDQSNNTSTKSSRGSTPNTGNTLTSESVDVRMIDFAHATHSGLDNAKFKFKFLFIQ